MQPTRQPARGHVRLARLAMLAAITLLAPLLGCERHEGEEITLAPESAAPAKVEVRIVSLAPALTRILIDLGMEKHLVGVAENDMAAPQSLPAVGNFLEINAEALLRLQPTHVLTMAGRNGTPGNLADLASAKKFQLVSYPMPLSVDAVARIIFDEQELLTDGASPSTGSPPSLATLFEVQRKASELKYHMLMQLAEIEKLVDSRAATRPRVLMVLGTQPLMASGPGTVHDGLLRFAGGVNAADGATVGAPVFDREALVSTVRPDVILLLSPQAPPLGPLQSDDRLAVLRDLDVPAVKNQRIALVNDPLVLLPSSSMAKIAGAMAKAIYPDMAQQIDGVLSSDFKALAGPVEKAAPAAEVPVPQSLLDLPAIRPPKEGEQAQPTADAEAATTPSATTGGE